MSTLAWLYTGEKVNHVCSNRVMGNVHKKKVHTDFCKSMEANEIALGSHRQ